MDLIRPLYHNSNALVPHTQGTQTWLLAKDAHCLEPHQVYQIDLGLWLPYLPAHTIVKLVDTHPKFTLLNYFWTASSDPLSLLILTHSLCLLERHDRLCRFTVEPIDSLFPGKP